MSWINSDNDFVGIVPVGLNDWARGMRGVATKGKSEEVGITICAATAGQKYKAVFYNGNVRIGSSSVFTVN